MSAAELLGRFARFLTNGIVDLQFAPGAVPLVLLLLALVVVAGLRLRSGNRSTAGWFIVFVTGALLLLIVTLNEVLRVIGTERLRYLIALWPLVALVAGCRPLAAGRQTSSAGGRSAGALADLRCSHKYEARVSL